MTALTGERVELARPDGTVLWPRPSSEDGPALDGRVRPLSEPEKAAGVVVALAVAVLGVVGLVNSFAAVAEAARESFGPMAWTVPVGIDLGIAVFSALDLLMARLNMRLGWLRLIPWTLTGATIWLNVAPETTWFGRVAHAVLPGMWVVAVEVGTHAVRTRAGLAAGDRMDSVRVSRWLLAPWSTARLWRRMVLWEIRSYREALGRERARLLAKTDLQDVYGRWWRWRAPRRARALYRLGELAPDSVADSVSAAGPDTPEDTSPDTGQDTAGDSGPGTGGASGRTPRRTRARDTAGDSGPDTAADSAAACIPP